MRCNPAMTEQQRVAEVIAWLHQQASKQVRDGMARFAIPSEQALGVSVGALRAYAKQLGCDQPLAEALWQNGIYEARMLATMVADAKQVTPKLMEAWCRDFDSWALCDTACFSLFDRTPHAFAKIKAWSKRQGEFQKRAAFALLACVAQHDKKLGDEPFLECLPLVEVAASDDRNFVKKGVSWALRGVGERSAGLHQAAMQIAQRLAASAGAAPRWVGKDGARQLQKPAVLARLQRRAKK